MRSSPVPPGLEMGPHCSVLSPLHMRGAAGRAQDRSPDSTARSVLLQPPAPVQPAGPCGSAPRPPVPGPWPPRAQTGGGSGPRAEVGRTRWEQRDAGRRLVRCPPPAPAPPLHGGGRLGKSLRPPGLSFPEEAAGLTSWSQVPPQSPPGAAENGEPQPAPAGGLPASEPAWRRLLSSGPPTSPGDTCPRPRAPGAFVTVITTITITTIAIGGARSGRAPMARAPAARAPAARPPGCRTPGETGARGAGDWARGGGRCGCPRGPIRAGPGRGGGDPWRLCSAGPGPAQGPTRCGPGGARAGIWGPRVWAGAGAAGAGSLVPEPPRGVPRAVALFT